MSALLPSTSTRLLLTLLALLLCSGASLAQTGQSDIHTRPSPSKLGQTPPRGEAKPNQVLVLGMIHSGHRDSERYSLPYLRALFEAVNPDIVLTEIPPERLPTAIAEFRKSGVIQEPRVKRFPEYVDVLFPLYKEKNFKIIGTAGWTKPMADARRAKMSAIEKDPARQEDWQAYQQAFETMESELEKLGHRDDPMFIHSADYDRLMAKAFGVYDRLFNDELGLGGWRNINAAHYAHIAKALDAYHGQGKRILITYGAAHKYWFLECLQRRQDIKLLNAKSFLEAAKNHRP